MRPANRDQSNDAGRKFKYLRGAISLRCIPVRPGHVTAALGLIVTVIDSANLGVHPLNYSGD
jgi:hypothetical protein